MEQARCPSEWQAFGIRPADAMSVASNLALSLAPVGIFKGRDDAHDSAKDGSKEHGSSPE